jgi:hypothetical protein
MGLIKAGKKEGSNRQLDKAIFAIFVCRCGRLLSRWWLFFAGLRE